MLLMIKHCPGILSLSAIKSCYRLFLNIIEYVLLEGLISNHIREDYANSLGKTCRHKPEKPKTKNRGKCKAKKN
jgi:hypothetical protein